MSELVVLGALLKDADGNPVPLSKWRRALASNIVCVGCRLELFILGYYWIKVTGKPDPRVCCIPGNRFRMSVIWSGAGKAVGRESPHPRGCKLLREVLLY
jgi:hypothetical protein